MNINTQYRIKNIPNFRKYLRSNSYWYKYLNRSNFYFKSFEDKFKKDYKLTPKDKLDRFTNNLDMITKFMDILK